MTYNIIYKDMEDIFLSRMRLDKPKAGAVAASLWLPEFDEGHLQEAERLNVILPLIKWCVENDMLTDELKDELDLYYEDYAVGKLDDILADYEKDDVLRDLTVCYKKVFL